MRVAVVGGGIFGCTAALYLARAGHQVELFEAGHRLLGGATGHQQARLHDGYHYPRSHDTGHGCRLGNPAFRQEYGQAIIDSGRHLYAVAARNSRVSGEQYLRFCYDSGLRPKVLEIGPPFNPEAVELVVGTSEVRVDTDRLRSLCEEKLVDAGVSVEFGTRPCAVYADRVVIAGYAETNAIAERFQASQQTYQFEVVEQAVLKMPDGFGPQSLVVMDGEFCCLDPLGATGLHLLGHVKHGVHHRSIGVDPEIPKHLKELVNTGIRRFVHGSRVNEMVAASAWFIPQLWEAMHVGSLFTVKCVSPDRDDTDERPTVVTPLNERVISVLSGKLSTCVEAAREIVALVGQQERAAA